VGHFSDKEARMREKPSMALHVDEEDDVSAGESWKMQEADQVRESISRPVEGCS